MSSTAFPTIMIALNLASAANCAWQGDSARMLYWLAAATLNYAITFPPPRFPWTH